MMRGIEAYRRGLRALALLLVLPTAVSAADEALTGIWNGVYSYPQEAKRKPVLFRLYVVQDGERLLGGIMERNTFDVGEAEGEEHWLHGILVNGRYDAATGAVTFTKRYDGTDGVDHDVAYTGELDDASVSGTWTIPGSWSGQFQVQKDDAAGSGRFSGTWSGSYDYPAGVVDRNGTPLRETRFWLVLLYDGEEVRGYLTEPNTFGQPEEPWLHALVKGTFDPDTGELVFTKEYDGTGDVDHTVEYRGQPADTDQSVSGSWTINGFGGTFEMQRGGRHPLDPPPGEKPSKDREPE